MRLSSAKPESEQQHFDRQRTSSFLTSEHCKNVQIETIRICGERFGNEIACSVLSLLLFPEAEWSDLGQLRHRHKKTAADFLNLDSEDSSFAHDSRLAGDNFSLVAKTYAARLKSAALNTRMVAVVSRRNRLRNTARAKNVTCTPRRISVVAASAKMWSPEAITTLP
jgi:hypothetical protein